MENMDGTGAIPKRNIPDGEEEENVAEFEPAVQDPRPFMWSQVNWNVSSYLKSRVELSL